MTLTCVSPDLQHIEVVRLLHVNYSEANRHLLLQMLITAFVSKLYPNYPAHPTHTHTQHTPSKALSHLRKQDYAGTDSN